MAKNMDFAFLLEIYENILTDKQRDVMKLYYWEDLSLSEISQNVEITRQAVRDSIKRSEQILEEFEKKLGLAEKITKCRANCNAICGYAETIKKEKQYDEHCIDTINELAAQTDDLF
ncbi:YlxM family DNA-binding protein [Porcipelethomonas sp.]|uniref:YlxM family DNA-binding protein n=1 Tax=Porcipelethomonas sp. TaxID=2981675 RepID=UPI003EFAA750